MMNRLSKKTCLIALVILAQSAFAQTVYKGTDANGNPVFSDKPFPNSKPVQIAPVQTFTPPPLTTQTVPTTTQVQENHHVVTILEPQNDQMIGHEIQTINVQIMVEPHLTKSEHIQLMLNDQAYGVFDSGTIPISDLPRGAYKLQANIISSEEHDKVIAQSPVITFYQQRITKIKPN